MDYVKGFVQLKHASPGDIVRFENGGYAIVSEYGYEAGKGFNMYLDGSGESWGGSNPDEWVAVMDMEAIEQTLELFDDVQYPASPKTDLSESSD